MAVYAAHLTRTLQGTPSVFQVTAADALGNTLKPALRKLAEYLSAVYPDKCGWSERWYDELYLVLETCLQYHYLKHYAASYSESFYGLYRIPTSHSSEFSSGQRLPQWAERWSLVLLVVAPYVRDKVERVVRGWREEDEDGQMGKTTKDTLRRAAIRLYTLIHFTTESAKLIQLARYLSGGAPSHAPSLALVGVTLRDAPPPHRGVEEHTWGDVMRGLLRGDFRSSVTFPMVGGALLGALQYGAFLVQLLRWWEARAPAASGALPPPQPPPRDANAVKWRNKCPVCLQPWRTPTALPVSGFVFCYTCVSRHVRSHGACPVTRLPARERDLVRLWVTDHER